MFAPIVQDGACCSFPRVPYSAADLPGEYHPAVRARFLRAARRDILPAARTRAEKLGLEERCEEIASAMLLHWYGLRSGKIAAGDHGHAVAATIRYFRLTGWHGMTGYRRSKSRKRTAEMLRWMERRKASLQDTPAAVAEARERIGNSPSLARKAYRLAKRSGIVGGVPGLLSEASLAECSERGRYVASPSPEPVHATDGDGTAWRGGNTVYGFDHGVQAVK